MEKVTIVIPAHNAEDSIKACINSALNQSYNNVEVVVVDDASTDATSKICQDFGDKIVFEGLIENAGGSNARNVGVEKSQGKYIAFLDSDDVFFPNKVQDQIDFMVEGSLSVSYCMAENEIGVELGKGYKKDFASELLIGDVDIVSSSAIMIEKTVHKEMNGFDIRFKRHQDIEYIVRASEMSKVGFLSKACFRKINSGSPSFSSVYQGVNLMWDVFHSKIQSFSDIRKKQVYAKGYYRFFELALKERKLSSVIYLFKAIKMHPKILFKKVNVYMIKAIVFLKGKSGFQKN